MTFVLGLTGSIGMGKSTTAQLFRARGVPVHDADATVHDLYRGEAAVLIEAAFPGTAPGGVVDRTVLAARLLDRPEDLARLEAIVHPLVARERNRFLEDVRTRCLPLAVLDVPLLLETGGQAICDAVLVVSAPGPVQRARVLARPGMTPEKMEAILARQWSDSRKRASAHIVIDTSRGLDAAARQVADVARTFAGRSGRRA